MAKTAIGPGKNQGLWRALVSAIADEIYESGSGNLIVRSISTYTAGDTEIVVESTDRFPDSGRLAIGGDIAFYTSKTVRTFEGLTDKNGDPGVPNDKPELTAIIDISRVNTQLDDLRAGFVVTTAEDVELDRYARNHGLFRPRGTADPTFRALLREITYGPAQTIFLIENILTVLFGAGNFSVWEDLETYPHTVFVGFPASVSADVFKGKTFLCGGEAQPSTGAFTVDVSNPPAIVYGIWDDTVVPGHWEPPPGGNRKMLFNLATLALFPLSTSALQPSRLTSVGLFLPSDDGKAVFTNIDSAPNTGILPAENHWRGSFIDANTLELASDVYTDDGDILLAGNTFTSTFKRFSPWMVGHTVEFLSGVHTGVQRQIASYNSPTSVELTGAALAVDNDIEWRLLPNFGTASPAGAARINRTTVVGNTITAPVALPADVVVDYTTIPSAQLLISALFPGLDQFPFYLWDEGSIIQQILDLITAAGVRVVLVQQE